jgi:YVTN family beta-propeller protein
MNRRLFLALRIVTACLLLAVASSASPSALAAGQYLGPTDVVASPDHTTLYVMQYDAGRIDAVDVQAGKVVRSIACPAAPTGLAVSADGTKLFITCEGPAGVVCVADAAAGRIVGQIAVGHTPGAPVLSPDGSRLYVSNRFNNNVSVIDLATNKEIQRVPAIREPIAAAISKDGATLFVCNLLPIDPADSYDVAAEITVIDTASLATSNIRLLNGSSSVFGICVSPDGKYAYVAHILSRYQMPTTQLERGWMNTNALSIVDVETKSLINTVLLDDIDLGASNPYAVTTTADGKTILVSHPERTKSARSTPRLAPETGGHSQDDGRGQGHGTVRRTRHLLVGHGQRRAERLGLPGRPAPPHSVAPRRPLGHDQRRRSAGQRAARSGCDRNQVLRSAVLQRRAGRRGPGRQGVLSGQVDSAGPRAAAYGGASRAHVLPRRRPLFPEMAELRQLPSGRPS